MPQNMLPIDASEVTDAQNEFLPLMTQTASVQRTAVTSDGQGGLNTSGGYVQQFTTPCMAFPDKMIPTLALKKEQGDRIQSVGNWSLLVPIGTDIRLNDQVVVGTITLVVIGTDVGRLNPVFLSFKCTEIK